MNSPEKNSEHPHSEFQDNLNLLRQTYFFSGLPLETLKVFAYLCTRQKFDPGERSQMTPDKAKSPKRLI